MMRQILLLFVSGFMMSCAGTNDTIQMDRQETEDFQISELKFNIKNDPANPVGYVTLGKAYTKSGEHEAAMSHFNQALDLSPNYTEALLQKALLLRKLGDNAAATPIFETLLSGNESEKNAHRIGKSIGHPFKTRLLTSGGFDSAFPNCSPEGDKLVLQSNKDGNWDIYLFDLQEEKYKRLTHNLARDESPVFAPDGLTIAFTSTRDDTNHTRVEELQRDIYTLRIDEGQAIRLTKNPQDDWSPAFSPNGESVLFSSDRGDKRRVPTNQRWSNLYRINLTTNEIEEITQSNGNDVSGWFSPDGEIIYFCSDRAGEYDIFEKKLKNSTIKKSLNHSGEDASVRVSRDGTRLVFFAKVDNNYDVFLADLQSGAIQRLTNHSGVDAGPDFSPLGDRVFFHSNRSGKYHIYCIDLTTPVSSVELQQVLR